MAFFDWLTGGNKKKKKDQQPAPKPQPKNPVVNIRGLTNTLSKGFDHANPFDGGRTWKQRTPTNKRSVFGQATHNGVTNVVGGAVRAPVRFANTANLAARQATEGAKMVAGLATGNSKAALKASERADQNYNRFAKRNSGLFGQGTFFKNPNEAKKGDFATTAKRVGGGTLETAATVLPVAKGGSVITKGIPTKKLIPKLAMEGAAYSAPSSIGAQLVENGRVNMKRLAQDTAAGAALAPATVIAGRGVVKTGKSATPVVRQGAQAIKNIDETPQTLALRDHNVLLQKNFDRTKDPRQRRVISQQIAKNNEAIRRTKQGGYVKNPLAGNDGGTTPQVPNTATPRLQNPAPVQPAKPQEAVSANLASLNNGRTSTPNILSSAIIPNTKNQISINQIKMPVATQLEGQPPVKPPRSTVSAINPEPKPNLPGSLGTQRQSQFAAKTVPESEFVSEAAKQQLNAPSYSVQTERAGYQASINRLQQEGMENFTASSRMALDKRPGTISRQEAIDATTAAQGLDALGDPTSLQRATEIYERLSEHYTAAGQLTQAASILSRRTPAGMMYSAQKQLRDANVAITPAIQTQLKTLIDTVATATDKQRATYALTQFVNSQIPSSLAERVSNVWRAGLLTAPTTTMGNLLGNTAETAIRKGFVNPVAAGVDKLISLKTGKRTQTLAPLGSGIQGAQEGASKLPEYMRTGYDERNVLDKYDNRSPVNYGDSAAGRAVERYANTVYRLMGTADQPYWYAAQKNALGSIAKSEAINRGLKGVEQQKFIDDFMANPPEAALTRSTQEAAYATFQNKTGLGKAAVAFKDGLNKVAPGLGDFIIPFTQVPASIATRVITRTPVGTATELVKQVMNVRRGGQFDQRAMSQAVAEGAFGTAVLGAGYALANSGLMTFGYPTDAKERALWESEGKQPYSVKVGDRWYSLNYIQPFGTLLAVGAKAGQDISDGKDLEDAIAGAFGTAGQSVANQSFVKGVSGAIDAITDPERSATKFINQTGASLVPNFVRSGARSFDGVQREPAGFVEGIMQGIPGLRQQTPEKTGVFGQPLPAKDNPINQLINPFRPSIDRSGNAALAESRKLQDQDLGVIPSQIKKDTFGKDYELNKNQLRELQNRVGKTVSDHWNKMVDTEEYKALSPEDQSKALKNLSSDILAVEKHKYASENNLPIKEKLSTSQSLIAGGGEGYGSYLKKTAGDGTKISSKVNKDIADFLLNRQNTDEWRAKKPNTLGKKLISEASSIRPSNFPELPANNRVAELYAEFKNKEADGMSPLKLNQAKRDFLKEAYSSEFSKDVKDIRSLGKDKTLEAIELGLITTEDFEKAVQMDNLLDELGLSKAKIPKKLREALGFGAAASQSGSGGGKGRKGKNGMSMAAPSISRFSLKGVPNAGLKKMAIKSFKQTPAKQTPRVKITAKL